MAKVRSSFSVEACWHIAIENLLLSRLVGSLQIKSRYKENGWTNWREETPPTAWKNKAQYQPFCYSNIKSTGSPYSNAENDSMYVPGNDIPSHSNFGYCTSPECPNTATYTPEICMPNELNGNIRYPSYLPRMTPIRYRESLGHNCHLLYSDPRLKAETDANNYYCQLNQHQYMKMCSQAYMRNYESNMCQMKQNVKKKRKLRHEPKSKIAGTLNSSSSTSKIPNLMESLNETDSLLPRHENISSYSNFHLTSSPIVSKGTTGTNILPNERNIVNTQTSLNPMKDEICQSQSDFQRFNSSYAINDDTFKTSEVSSTISNQQVNLSTTSDETNVNSSTQFDINCSTNSSTNEEMKGNSTYVDNSDLSNPPAEEIPQEEQMHQIFNIKDSTLEYSNMNTENIIFQPIFEGKDENGEDVIVLLAAPATEQGVCQENIFDTTVNAEDAQLISNQEMTTNSIEIANFSDQNNLEIDVSAEPQITDTVDNENSEENQSQIVTNGASQNNIHILSHQNESVIISDVNDFFLEEVVDASESNCPNTKRTKKHEIELAKNIAVKKNGYKRKKCHEASFLDKINTSKSSQFQVTLTNSEKFSDNVNIPDHLPKNYKKFNMKFKAKKLKWKRHFQWKSNTQINGLKNMYFAKIMKRLRHQYKGIKHDVVWVIMKIILDKIGGSVLQSIYNTVQLLAKMHVQKSSKQKTVNSILKKK